MAERRLVWLWLVFLVVGVCDWEMGMLMVVGKLDVGVNWGTQATQPLPPTIVVQLLKDNQISKVKLFDADYSTMSALSGSNIEVMIAIPNNMLEGIAGSYSAAQNWVKKNVTRYNFSKGVNIKYVAVGNEPFLSSYNGTFLNVTYPALKNIQTALNEAGLSSIKATVPLNADVYNTDTVPSAGHFRSDINALMVQIVQFLSNSGAPFTVNIYPYISAYQDDGFPMDYAFFNGAKSPVVDGSIRYQNVFDANFDTLLAALKLAGVPNLPIIIGEVGWPTDGDKRASNALAQSFYAGLLTKLVNNVGTPLRPGHLEVYLFGLLDENGKSTAPGNFERHWGIFSYDGKPKFPMDLVNGLDTSAWPVAAKNVQYLANQWCVLKPSVDLTNKIVGDNINFACTFSDCTALGYGSTCNSLDAKGNASYAFNMYYQVHAQKDGSCDFQGLATVTTTNPSSGTCNFPIQVVSWGYSSSYSSPSLVIRPSMTLLFAVFLGFLLFV